VAKLPRPTGKEMIRFLERQGLRVIRVAGSHHFMDGGGKRTTVPVHGNQNLKIGTLRSILRDIDMSPIEFERLWNS
jgi:predicted RNA binding protein YcfA (HicA-like mRNA interferase family)